MVKVTINICILFLLLMRGSCESVSNSKLNISSEGVQDENSTMVKIQKTKGNPVNATISRVKQIKAEMLAYYRNLHKHEYRIAKNVSSHRSRKDELIENGKSIRKITCEPIIKTQWEDLRLNPLQVYESLLCPPRNPKPKFDVEPAYVPSVKIVNSTELGDRILLTDLAIKNHSEPGNCTVVIFYARWCNLSAKAAPYFNAIPRAFKNINFVAVDTYKHPEVVSTFVIYAVPTVLLFHNGRIHARFTNESLDIASLENFLEKYTDQESESVQIQPNDHNGPIPTIAIPRFQGEELIFAWVFILISCIYGLFTKPAFNLFLVLYLKIQSLLDDVEFSDSKFRQGRHF